MGKKIVFANTRGKQIVLVKDLAAPFPSIDEPSEKALSKVINCALHRRRMLAQKCIGVITKMVRRKHPRFAFNHTRVKLNRRK